MNPLGNGNANSLVDRSESAEKLTPTVASAEDQIVAEAMSKTHMPLYLTGFLLDIEQFNKMYKMPEVEAANAIQAQERLSQFYSILDEECKELAEIKIQLGHNVAEHLVPLADLLGDLIVYCASEARRWNIPIDKVLAIIMQSNFSKMGPDGPIYDERGKLMKGPNYYKPEEKIAALLKGESA